MKTSESITTIAAVLPKVQAVIKGATKDATNPHFKSRYADLTSVIDACKAALNAHGITFLQPVRAGESGVIVETVLLHSSGEWISEELALPVSKNDAQGVGSAITYGRRYGLQSMVGIPAEDDDGNAAAKAPPKDGLNGAEVCKTELDRMTPAEQETIRANADTILDLYNADMKQEASDHFYAIDSQEKQMAVWAFLREHSAVRSSVKKLRRQDALLTQA